MRWASIIAIMIFVFAAVGFSKPVVDNSGNWWNKTPHLNVSNYNASPQEEFEDTNDTHVVDVIAPLHNIPVVPGMNFSNTEDVREIIEEHVKEMIKSKIETRLRVQQRVREQCGDIAEKLKEAVLEGNESKILKLRAQLKNCSVEYRNEVCEKIQKNLSELRNEFERCLTTPNVNSTECEGIILKMDRLTAQMQICERYTETGIREDCDSLERRLGEMKQIIKNCIGSENATCLAVRLEFTDTMKEYAKECRLKIGKIKDVVGCEAEKQVLEKIKEKLEKKLESVNNSTARKRISEKVKQLGEVMEGLKNVCKRYPNPCLRAEKLEKAYSVLLNESNASDVAVFEIESKLELLRKLCVEENISVENVSSLKEVEDILEKKLGAVASLDNTSEMVQMIKKVREEKRKLIKKYVEKKKKLDLIEQKLIKRLVITKNKLITENETLPPAEVMAEVKNKLLKILPKGDNVVIQDVVNVTADEVIYENGTLKTPMGRVIKVLPSEILDKVKTRVEDKIKEMKLENQFHPRYRAKVIEKRRLFGIVPWDLEVDKVVDAETGKLIEENRPWWSFLLF